MGGGGGMLHPPPRATPGTVVDLSLFPDKWFPFRVEIKLQPAQETNLGMHA